MDGSSSCSTSAWKLSPFSCSRSRGCTVMTHCGFNFQFSDEQYCEHLFKCWLVIWFLPLWSICFSFLSLKKKLIYLPFYYWFVRTLYMFCLWVLHHVSVLIQALLAPLHVCSVTQSCPAPSDSMDSNPPGSSGHGILQSRILECVAISCSGGSSQPRDWTRVSYLLHWQTDSLSLHHLQSPFDSFNGAFWWAEVLFCCCYFSVIFF